MGRQVSQKVKRACDLSLIVIFLTIAILLISLFTLPTPKFEVIEAIYYSYYGEVSITIKNTGNAPAYNVTTEIVDEEMEFIRKVNHRTVEAGKTITVGTHLNRYTALITHKLTLTYTYKAKALFLEGTETKTITLYYTPKYPYET